MIVSVDNKNDHPKKLYIYINRNEVKGPQDI